MARQRCWISNSSDLSTRGLAMRIHSESARSATSKAPNWANVQAMIVASIAGSTRRGIRRKALRATVDNAALPSPARLCRRGFKAATKPVTKAKMVTPIRPCQGIRKKGICISLGGPISVSAGKKRSISHAREIWVTTTITEAMPRRPWIGLRVSRCTGTLDQHDDHHTSIQTLRDVSTRRPSAFPIGLDLITSWHVAGEAEEEKAMVQRTKSRRGCRQLI